MLNNIILFNSVVITFTVVIVSFLVERIFFKEQVNTILRKLGFVFPKYKTLAVSILISIVLFIFYPVLSKFTGYNIDYSNLFITLQIGVFLVHGIAEELVYRGFLFRHLREMGLKFMKACFISIIFFAAAHIPVIASMGLIVGLTAFLLAAISAFPLAYLFERSGNSILPPAIIHFAIDTVIPVLGNSEQGTSSQIFSLCWMILSMVVPYLAFLFLNKNTKSKNVLSES